MLHRLFHRKFRTLTQSPGFRHGVKYRDKKDPPCYTTNSHLERDLPEANVVQTARDKTRASGNSPCSKISGQDLYEQVSADIGPGMGLESESVRNPLALDMGRFNVDACVKMY